MLHPDWPRVQPPDDAPNSGAVTEQQHDQTRVTWNAVTSGTPSCSTFAVMHISAMPPGAVPSTSVAG